MITMDQLKERNKYLAASPLFAGLGGVGLLGSLAAYGETAKTRNVPLSIALGLAGAANLAMTVAAVKKAHNVAPITIGDASVVAARPAAMLATGIPAYWATSVGGKMMEDAMKAGKITPQAALGAAGLFAAGIGSAAVGGVMMNHYVNANDEATAKRLGVQVGDADQ